jgi:putative transposase
VGFSQIVATLARAWVFQAQGELPMASHYAGRNDQLPRLDREMYRGQSYAHWVLTIQDRRTGWLIPAFYYKFRELLTHTAFRYAITCPIYCLMPDHMHLLWIGIDDKSDQLNAMKFFRKHSGHALEKLGFEFQHQSYDHVLRDDERLESAFLEIVEYIARNPERKQIVPVDGYRDYKFTGCLVPGYPELTPWQLDYWPRFWRAYSFLRTHGLFRTYDEDVET